MKKNTLLLLFFNLHFFSNLTSQSIQWSAQKEVTVAAQNQTFVIPTGGIDPCTDSENNVYVIGYYQSDSKHGQSEMPQGSFISKYNSTGTLIWSNVISEFGLALAINKNKIIYITGHDTSGYYVSKYNSGGNILIKTILFPKTNKYNGMIRGISIDTSNNYFITGVFRDTLAFGNTVFYNNMAENHLFIAKYNAEDVFQWARTSSSANISFRTGIKTDRAGNCYVHADYTGNLTLANTTFSSMGCNAFITKYDKDGNFQWLFNSGGNGDEGISAVMPDKFGNIYAIGDYINSFTIGSSTLTGGNQDANIFFMKLNANGTPLFAKQLKGDAPDSPGGIALNNDGEVFLSGTYRSSISLNGVTLTNSTNLDEPFFAKFDSNGQLFWAINAGCSTDAYGYSAGLCLDDAGDLYITGDFFGNTSFGDYPLIGQKSMFLIKIKGGGEELARINKNSPTAVLAFNVFPNPSTGDFRISCTVNIKTTFELNILNTKGEKLYSQRLEAFQGDFEKDVDLSRYPKGMYIIEILSEGKRAVQRQVKN